MSSDGPYFASDTHFKHRRIVEFVRKDGVELRPWNTVEDHDDAIIDRWNDAVPAFARVYHLGDSHMSKDGAKLLSCLSGQIVLIPGNHDTRPASDYLDFGVYDIRGYKEFQSRGWILSHIPIHESQLVDRWKVNIHGHMHSDVINDPRYLCVSMEQINFTPISIEEVERRILENNSAFNQYGRVINFATGTLTE